MLSTPPVPPANAEAWLQRGHHCAASGRSDDLRLALDCYDRARELAGPDLSDTATLRWLALSWLNRGNVLQQLGPANFPAAHSAYDAASAALSTLELTSMIRLHQGALWTNRGRLLLREDHLPAARHAFQRAIDQLTPAFTDATHGDTARRNAAGAALNLVLTHLGNDDHLREHHAELAPLVARLQDWLAPLAATDPIAAGLVLEATRLDLLLREAVLKADDLAAFTDTLETGLALTARWIARDHPTAAELGATLFRLGAITYGRHQPHFLLEFLRESLDPTAGAAPFRDEAAFREIAAEAVAAVRADLDRPRALDADDPAAHALAALRHNFSVPLPWLETRATTAPSSSS
ncbi:hypothetical protein [Actomonas aquatica]|uniref:Tetratricopeptide repeat protein n=1 Tax=Actomonas aquatica TaxID=2866162 RepID=A0ABZ1C6F0_9BACT|nr:hypothetical protein [Opitutus sp. WL0086]WRQ86902.1 hypothetical protein K1X11_018980 [Opitutus sp. WL0086]